MQSRLGPLNVYSGISTFLTKLGCHHNCNYRCRFVPEYQLLQATGEAGNGKQKWEFAQKAAWAERQLGACRVLVQKHLQG